MRRWVQVNGDRPGRGGGVIITSCSRRRDWPHFVHDSITSPWTACFSVVSVGACVVLAWWWSRKRSLVGGRGGVILRSCLHALPWIRISIGCCGVVLMFTLKQIGDAARGLCIADKGLWGGFVDGPLCRTLGWHYFTMFLLRRDCSCLRQSTWWTLGGRCVVFLMPQ